MNRTEVYKVFTALVLFPALCFCIFLLLYTVSKADANTNSIISPLSSTALIPTPSEKPNKEELSASVEKALEGTKGTYSIVVNNLKTGEAYMRDEHRVYEPGSLYKIWIMAAVYDAIDKGKLKEEKILTQDVQTLNDEFQISSESAELTEGTISMSVADAISQMITISHNYAALLLSQAVGLSNVTAFLLSHGLNESFIGQPPKVSAYDIAFVSGETV